MANTSDLMDEDVFQELVPKDFPKELVDLSAISTMFKSGSNIIDPSRIAKFVDVLQTRFERNEGRSYGLDDTSVKPCKTLDELPVKK